MVLLTVLAQSQRLTALYAASSSARYLLANQSVFGALGFLMLPRKNIRSMGSECNGTKLSHIWYIIPVLFAVVGRVLACVLLVEVHVDLGDFQPVYR